MARHLVQEGRAALRHVRGPRPPAGVHAAGTVRGVPDRPGVLPRQRPERRRRYHAHEPCLRGLLQSAQVPLSIGRGGRVCGWSRTGEVHDTEGTVGDIQQVARGQVLLQGGPTGFQLRLFLEYLSYLRETLLL